jgi:hypothetical protein
MTSLEDESRHWPVPQPGQAIRFALAQVDDLFRRGALDEGTAHVWDRLVDHWVVVWQQWAATEHQIMVNSAAERVREARGMAAFTKQILQTAHREVDLARQNLLAVGLRPSPQIGLDTLVADGPLGDTAALAFAATPGPRARLDDPPLDSNQVPSHAPTPPLPVTVAHAVGRPVLLPSQEEEKRGFWAWVRREWAWITLTIMAGGDAVGIYVTLVVKLAAQQWLLPFFVTAITVASVVTAHTMGRLARRAVNAPSRHAWWWIGTLATPWAALGLGIAWLRAHTSITTGTGFDNQNFAGGDTSHPDWMFAGLLLMLYLMTGVVAMTHAYRTSDPNPDPLPGALNLLRRAQEVLADRVYAHRKALGEVADADAELTRLREDTSHLDVCTTVGDSVKHEVRLRLAREFGDPPRTEAVLDDAFRLAQPAPQPGDVAPQNRDPASADDGPGLGDAFPRVIDVTDDLPRVTDADTDATGPVERPR